MTALLMNRWIQLAGAGVVILLLLWRWLACREEIGELNVKLDTQRDETVECATANESNQTTIGELQGRIDSLLLTRAQEAAEREQALSERDAAINKLRTAEAAERRTRRELFRSTARCEGLAGLRVDVACPAIADRLRSRTSQGGD
jgi:predicted RNase H-like nuclease (RuvC/YqgF family)